MIKRPSPPADAAALRLNAEQQLRQRSAGPAAQRTEAEAERLVHELEVHQIELEMQNDELQQERTRLELLGARYADLYDFAPSAYFSFDPEGRICLLNLHGARLIGVDRSRLLQRRMGLFIAAPDRAAFSAFLRNVFASSQRQQCEVALLKEGQQELLVRIEGIVSEEGDECRAVLFDLSERRLAEQQARTAVIDSKNMLTLSERSRQALLSAAEDQVLVARALRESEQQRHEELQRHANELEQRVAERTIELEAAKVRAEAADRVKSAFLATMSHELRTPLNSIIGFTGVLLQGLSGALNAEQEKQLGIVRNASRHLLALINDVLDISKVEAGELHFVREHFDLHALIERLGAAFAPQARQRGLRFVLDIDPGQAIILADQRRVEQVLNNLLGNALKFTPKGSITLACKRGADHHEISVTDTGVGIKPEDMDKLFRPFSQLETGLPDLREGTGLGLAISKQLAHGMGGHVTALSLWGKGSCFTFLLPTGDCT